MRTIQERALDLFDERGFSQVTIEAVATAAEVSPSTVYRLFGTKEGLLDADDPVGSLVNVVLRYEAAPTAETRGGPDPARRIRYFFDEPLVRMAACAALDRASQRIAPLLPDRELSDVQTRVAANALVFGCFGALEEWHRDGATKPIADYVDEGLRPLRRLWQ